MRRQKSWLDRLSAAARWRLGAKEAGEVIADYREIVGGSERSEEALMQEVGVPLDAVKPLTDQKTYRIWLAVFAVLAAWLVLPGLSPLPGGFSQVWWELFGAWHYARAMALLVLSAAVTLAWFRWKGWKGETLPRGALTLLTVVLAWTIAVMGVGWVWMHAPSGFAEMWGRMPAPLGLGGIIFRSYWVLGEALEWIGGAGMTVIGIVALVKARTRDRRWAAVYILAMTAMLVSLEQLALISYTHVDSGSCWAGYSTFFYSWVKLVALGLMGTGVALC